jgi:hypothetical protein
MGELSASDVRAVLDLVGELHHAEDRAALARLVLPPLQALVGAQHALLEPASADAEEAWARHYATTRDGRARRVQVAGGHQLVVAVPDPGGGVVGLVLAREGPPFGDRDVALLELLRPHLIQALREAGRRERLRQVASALCAALDDAGEAVVVVDQAGRVLLASAAGAAAVREVVGEPPELGQPLAAALLGREIVAQRGRRWLVRALDAGDGLRAVVLRPAAQAASRQVLEALGLSSREAEVLQGGRSSSTAPWTSPCPAPTGPTRRSRTACGSSRPRPARARSRRSAGHTPTASPCARPRRGTSTSRPSCRRRPPPG